MGNCVIPKITMVCTHRPTIPDVPARALCEANNTKPRAELAWALGKKEVVTGAKIAAEGTVASIRQNINKLPIDIDSRVASLLASREVANLSLKAAEEAAKRLDQVPGLLAAGLDAVGSLKGKFSLDESLISGDLDVGLSGQPVVMDLNFTLDGKSHHNRFAFTLTNGAENIGHFTTMALGIAVGEVVKAGLALKVIPLAGLDKVEQLFLTEAAKDEAELQTAIAANGNANVPTDPANAALSLVHAINQDHKTRRAQAELDRQTLIDLEKSAGDAMSDARIAQLASLLKGNHWKLMPGEAVDIAAGANGSVWSVGADQNVYKWSGSNWTKVSGIKALRIDVGPWGYAWVVTPDNSMYRWNGEGWDKLPGQGVDIGVGSDGSAWMVDTKGLVFKWNGVGWDNVKAALNTTAARWPKIEQPATGPKIATMPLAHGMPGSRIPYIDVDDEGRAWTIEDGNLVARWNPSENLWNGFPATALDVGVGADGTPILTRWGNVDPAFEHAPHVWDGKTLTRMPGGGKSITVDAAGDPWVVDAANNIWAWRTAAKAPAAKISVTAKLKVQSSGRCLQHSGGQDNPTIQWDCSPGNPFQVFTVLKRDGEWFSLVNATSKLCISIDNASQADGGATLEYACHDGHDQQWRKVERPDGQFLLQNRNSRKCLNLAYGKAENGAPYDQFRCGYGNTTQLFSHLDSKSAALFPPSVKAGKVARLKVHSSSRCLQHSGGQNLPTIQMDCEPGNPFQGFTVSRRDGGWFSLVNAMSELCVTIGNASMDNGGTALELPCHNGHEQHWRKVERGDNGFLLQNRNSSKCLNLAYGKPDNGAPYDQFHCGANNPTQVFRLLDVESAALFPSVATSDKVFRFQVKHSGWCLRNAAGQGEQTHQWDCDMTNPFLQYTVLEPDGEWFSLNK